MTIIIPISDNSNSERVSRDSLVEETSSSGSLDELISNVGKGINRVEVLMPHHTLFEKKVQANRQMRERVNYYIQHRLRTDNFKPNDVEVKAHLDL